METLSGKAHTCSVVRSSKRTGDLRAPGCCQKRACKAELRQRNLQCCSRSRSTAQICKAQTGSPTVARPKTAKESVEKGLVEFHERKDAAAALQLFERALQLSPSEEEARAAVYNSACAHAKLKHWDKAAAAAVEAINTHGERLSTAIKDPDLAKLRERREWMDALDLIKGATSSNSLVRLQGEARAPFRFARLILVGVLDAGAIVGLVIIASRLISALKGGEGAPELGTALKDFTINAVAVTALSAIFGWDITNSSKDRQGIEREESLGRLQVTLGQDRVLPLAYLRGRIRPVVIAGTSSFVSKALSEAAPYKRSLRDRGVSVIPLRLKAADPSSSLASLKAEFKGSKGQQEGKGFGDAKAPASDSMPPPGEVLSAVEDDQRWKIEPAGLQEWETWLQKVKDNADIKAGNIYLQVQLNGKVRASGEGRPPWQKLVDELPLLDDPRTRFGDGLGRR